MKRIRAALAAAAVFGVLAGGSVLPAPQAQEPGGFPSLRGSLGGPEEVAAGRLQIVEWSSFSGSARADWAPGAPQRVFVVPYDGEFDLHYHARFAEGPTGARLIAIEVSAYPGEWRRYAVDRRLAAPGGPTTLDATVLQADLAAGWRVRFVAAHDALRPLVLEADGEGTHFVIRLVG